MVNTRVEYRWFRHGPGVEAAGGEVNRGVRGVRIGRGGIPILKHQAGLRADLLARPATMKAWVEWELPASAGSALNWRHEGAYPYRGVPPGGGAK